jgi:sugar phosphate isomerase/epimerase
MKKYYILICATLLATHIHAQLFDKPFGVQAYTFRRQMPKNLEGVLDTIKLFGITELETGVPKGMTPEAFKKLCNDRGISIPSTGGGYEQLVRNPDSLADIAKRLGASYLMCAWIPHKKRGSFTFEEAKKAVEDFNKIGKALHAQGITFCYHDHGYEFQPYGKGTLMDYIIENTDPQYVSFEMDVLWTMHGGGDPVKLLKKYKGRWKLMHVKDLRKGVKGDLTGGTPAENDVAVGEGQANWRKIIKVAKKVGVKHFFIEDESNIEMVNVPKSIAYLKTLK